MTPQEDRVQRELGLLLAEWRARTITDEQYLRGIDLALHPWGEPGEEPTEAGKYWVYWPAQRNGTYSAVLLPDGDLRVDGVDSAGSLWLTIEDRSELAASSAQPHRWCFRKRWTPEAPQ